MRADVMQRISGIWNEYQEFLESEVAGTGYTLREMMEEADDDEIRGKTLVMTCGEPPFEDRNCALLAWEIERGRWD